MAQSVIEGEGPLQVIRTPAYGYPRELNNNARRILTSVHGARFDPANYQFDRIWLLNGRFKLYDDSSSPRTLGIYDFDLPQSGLSKAQYSMLVMDTGRVIIGSNATPEDEIGHGIDGVVITDRKKSDEARGRLPLLHFVTCKPKTDQPRVHYADYSGNQLTPELLRQIL